jgi:hypothetical protein
VALAADLSPREVSALDGSGWVALTAALEERWTKRDEMLALTVELLHAIWRLQLRRPPPPFTIERPYERAGKRKPVSGRQLAGLLGVGPGGER